MAALSEHAVEQPSGLLGRKLGGRPFDDHIRGGRLIGKVQGHLCLLGREHPPEKAKIGT